MQSLRRTLPFMNNSYIVMMTYNTALSMQVAIHTKIAWIKYSTA